MAHHIHRDCNVPSVFSSFLCGPVPEEKATDSLPFHSRCDDDGSDSVEPGRTFLQRGHGSVCGGHLRAGGPCYV